MKKLTTLIMMVSIAIILIVTGCGPSVGIVTEAKLTGHEETTIGKAFDASFNDVKWELKTTDKGAKFVEFTGKLKNAIGGLDDGSDMILMSKGGNVKVQFLIKDKSFEICHAEAIVGINPDLQGQLKEVAKNVMSFSGMEEGKPLNLNQKGINALITGIYR
jgi:hypothetical protein